MKLSELVNYYNELDKLSTVPVVNSVESELAKISCLIDQQKVQFDQLSNELELKHSQIKNQFEDYEQILNKFKHEFKQLISESEKSWFAESYRLYDEEMVSETVEDIKHRTTTNNLSENTVNFYLARLSKYNSWKYSAIIIRPGFEQYINHMVGCDPLYIIDTRHELLEPAMIQYNEIYQQRLRPYVVQERDNNEILQRLPDSQFGLVFAYNFFNFRPFEIIKRYLQEIYKKLHAGGTLIMTFNDCERDKAVMLVEQHFCCYTPGYLVKDLAQNIGFELTLTWNDGGPSTWLELRKPGNFESLRGGQTLAKIVPKSIAESK
jgi:SAM-dependent methyltransferase